MLALTFLDGEEGFSLYLYQRLSSKLNRHDSVLECANIPLIHLAPSNEPIPSVDKRLPVQFSFMNVGGLTLSCLIRSAWRTP